MGTSCPSTPELSRGGRTKMRKRERNVASVHTGVEAGAVARRRERGRGKAAEVSAHATRLEHGHGLGAGAPQQLRRCHGGKGDMME
jgi:hypothetical protein